MKHIYLAFILLLVSTFVQAEPIVPNEQPQRTPEDVARKQTYRLVRELNLTDSIIIDSIYRINIRHNLLRMQGMTRAQEYNGLQQFIEELRGILTEEQFNVFMNQTVNVPRHPHASYAPARPDSMTRKQKAP